MNYDILKAKDYNPRKAGRIHWVERKLDGHRIVIEKTQKGVKVRTRTEGVNLWPQIQDIRHLANSIWKINTGTVLDCELWEEGSYSTDIKTRLNEGSENLRITPFAIPYFNGHTTNHDSMDPHFFFRLFEKLGFHVNHYWTIGEQSTFGVDYWREKATELGWEGFIAKERHLSGWWKVKPVRTGEVVVTGINRSTSATYYGDIKSLRGSVYDNGKLVEVGNVGGLTAEQRSKPEDYFMGQVVEVEFDSLAGQGRLRFPRFKRLRMDKLPSECTMEQLQ
ncbi:MAG: hypothetical protein CMF17_11805 [Idiomarinaceae bacterium]|nr:hypothetical protein [Idiomarinaceae bacterium]